MSTLTILILIVSIVGVVHGQGNVGGTDRWCKHNEKPKDPSRQTWHELCMAEKDGSEEIKKCFKEIFDDGDIPISDPEKYVEILCKGEGQERADKHEKWHDCIDSTIKASADLNAKCRHVLG